MAAIISYRGRAHIQFLPAPDTMVKQGDRRGGGYSKSNNKIPLRENMGRFDKAWGLVGVSWKNWSYRELTVLYKK